MAWTRFRGRMLVLPLVAAAMAACAKQNAGESCGGRPGLHVLVDLSGPSHCDALVEDPQNEESVTATLSNGQLDRFNADHVLRVEEPPSVDYLWSWPSGAADGWEGTITWTGQLDFFGGHAEASYQVHLADCVDLVLTATCGSVGPDAGIPPDAP